MPKAGSRLLLYPVASCRVGSKVWWKEMPLGKTAVGLFLKFIAAACAEMGRMVAYKVRAQLAAQPSSPARCAGLRAEL